MVARWLRRKAATPGSAGSLAPGEASAGTWPSVTESGGDAVKRCAVCAQVVPAGKLRCPQCGSGSFTPDKAHASSSRNDAGRAKEESRVERTRMGRDDVGDSDEATTLKRILDQSLDAKRFTNAALQHGFRFIQEGPMGLKMESDRGRFMLGVFGSIHETNIATLVYLDKASNKTVCLVDGGRRQYR